MWYKFSKQYIANKSVVSVQISPNNEIGFRRVGRNGHRVFVQGPQIRQAGPTILLDNEKVGAHVDGEWIFRCDSLAPWSGPKEALVRISNPTQAMRDSFFPRARVEVIDAEVPDEVEVKASPLEEIAVEMADGEPLGGFSGGPAESLLPEDVIPERVISVEADSESEPESSVEPALVPEPEREAKPIAPALESLQKIRRRKV